MMNRHRSTSSSAVSGLGMQFVTSVISTTMVLLLLGLVVFFVLAAHNLSVFVKENINFSILLSEDMKESDILKLQHWLDQEDFVKQTEYVSKEQALKILSEELGADPKEFLGYNPFTAAIEVRMNSRYANPDSIARIEALVRQQKQVVEVVYQKDLVDAVNKNVRDISLFLLGLAAVLAVISFSLINNTIRLTIYSRRFLIHTMKLVGASWSFIRRPFLRRSLWTGFLSGVISAGILWGAAYALVGYEPALIEVVTTDVMLAVSASVILFGLLITWLCAFFSINRYLRMKGERMYYV